jgi:hypothetical protein
MHTWRVTFLVYSLTSQWCHRLIFLFLFRVPTLYSSLYLSLLPRFLSKFNSIIGWHSIILFYDCSFSILSFHSPDKSICAALRHFYSCLSALHTLVRFWNCWEYSLAPLVWGISLRLEGAVYTQWLIKLTARYMCVWIITWSPWFATFSVARALIATTSARHSLSRLRVRACKTLPHTTSGPVTPKDSTRYY